MKNKEFEYRIVFWGVIGIIITVLAIIMFS